MVVREQARTRNAFDDEKTSSNGWRVNSMTV